MGEYHPLTVGYIFMECGWTSPIAVSHHINQSKQKAYYALPSRHIHASSLLHHQEEMAGRRNYLISLFRVSLLMARDSRSLADMLYLCRVGSPESAHTGAR